MFLEISKREGGGDGKGRRGRVGGEATNAKCGNILGDQRPETCREMSPVHGS
jgi:hypothetical protein